MTTVPAVLGSAPVCAVPPWLLNWVAGAILFHERLGRHTTDTTDVAGAPHWEAPAIITETYGRAKAAALASDGIELAAICNTEIGRVFHSDCRINLVTRAERLKGKMANSRAISITVCPRFAFFGRPEAICSSHRSPAPR